METLQTKQNIKRLDESLTQYSMNPFLSMIYKDWRNYNNDGTVMRKSGRSLGSPMYWSNVNRLHRLLSIDSRGLSVEELGRWINETYKLLMERKRFGCDDIDSSSDLTDPTTRDYEATKFNAHGKVVLRQTLPADMGYLDKGWTSESRLEPKSGVFRRRLIHQGIPLASRPRRSAKISESYAETFDINLNFPDPKINYSVNKSLEFDLNISSFHDGNVRESDHDRTSRLKRGCADLTMIDLDSPLHRLETDPEAVVRQSRTIRRCYPASPYARTPEKNRLLLRVCTGHPSPSENSAKILANTDTRAFIKDTRDMTVTAMEGSCTEKYGPLKLDHLDPYLLWLWTAGDSSLLRPLQSTIATLRKRVLAMFEATSQFLSSSASQGPKIDCFPFRDSGYCSLSNRLKTPLSGKWMKGPSSPGIFTILIFFRMISTALADGNNDSQNLNEYPEWAFTEGPPVFLACVIVVFNSCTVIWRERFGDPALTSFLLIFSTLGVLYVLPIIATSKVLLLW